MNSGGNGFRGSWIRQSAHHSSAARTGKPIKIAHVLHSFHVGGLENGVVNLINGLEWGKYAHVVCCLTRSGRLANSLQRTDVEIIELDKTKGPNLSLPLRLARVFKRINPAIVHTRNWATIDGIIGARFARVPIVVHGEHGLTISEVNGNSRRRALIRWMLSFWVDQFVIVSAAQRRWIETTLGINGSKVATICNGVNLEKFRYSGNRLSARSEFHLDANDFVFGTVGRLDPVKDQASLVRAFSCLATAYPKIKLIIVGRGPCEKQLKDFVQQLGLTQRVVCLDEQDDVTRVFRCMDVFILPSISEGSSNTILEAMASSLPVIATAVGGNPELVCHGETGRLIPKQDTSRLAEAMRLYLTDPELATRHGNAGFLRVKQEFALARMLSAYDTLYSSLISRDRIDERTSG